MNVQILELIDGAKAAKGLTVIIDVFRAMTVEAYVIKNGAVDLIPMGDIQEAYAYRDAHPGTILMGSVAVPCVRVLILEIHRLK